ncbi:type II secretion system F family protein [Candidatus Halocynthiibacter alkanivorans]|jgi:tight adherence protein C|uniref:type II secretion system F family protein n=1 Tax=Candidatus Halocynthiibacter alkanivorans TaxID=2267619 RepID=UPI000DF24C35|nr:type II secretion system F family protein [Candidatus Halocynthiibacter alkanivorans]
MLNQILDQLRTLIVDLNLTTETVVVMGMALGVLLIFLGVFALLTDKDAAAVRIANIVDSKRQDRLDRGLLRAADNEPTGMMKSLLPSNFKERSDLRRKLAQAGFPRPGALRNFTLLRVLLGLAFPGVLLSLFAIEKTKFVELPIALADLLANMSNLHTFLVLTLLVVMGYFAPLNWLNARAVERQRRIEEAFPNALDLMQISVEAGLGFDAAMTRIGNELAAVTPDISFEFLSAQRQIQAGQSREVAMADMALRSGVDMVRSFSNVVKQSMQFGTPMSDALRTYSREMRADREVRAQEMANKLPVKMSAVLASLMLPALLLLTIGPVLIRYIRYFSG